MLGNITGNKTAYKEDDDNKINTEKDKYIIKKGDIYIIAAVLFLTLVSIIVPGIFSAGNNIRPKAVIIQDNKVIKEINLEKIDKAERFEIRGYYNITVLMEQGRIRFEEADCPDKLCVKTGWLSKPGDTAICLPARVIIKIEGEKEDNEDVDGVTY